MAGYTPFGLTELDLKRARRIAEAYSHRSHTDRCEEAIVEAMASLVKDRDDVFRVIMAWEMGDAVPDDINPETMEVARSIRDEATSSDAPERKGLPIL